MVAPAMANRGAHRWGSAPRRSGARDATTRPRRRPMRPTRSRSFARRCERSRPPSRRRQRRSGSRPGRRRRTRRPRWRRPCHRVRPTRRARCARRSTQLPRCRRRMGRRYASDEPSGCSLGHVGAEDGEAPAATEHCSGVERPWITAASGPEIVHLRSSQPGCDVGRWDRTGEVTGSSGKKRRRESVHVPGFMSLRRA